MGARRKLNQAYLNGSLLFAGTIGLVTESFVLFLVVLGALVTFNLQSGEIRPHQRGRRR